MFFWFSKNSTEKLNELIDSEEKISKFYKKVLIIVSISQIFGGAGLAAGITVGALIAKDIQDYITSSIIKSEKFEFEKKYFDFYFNEHPFIKYTEFFWENAPDIIQQLTSPKQIPDNLERGRFQLYGIINKIIIKKSKKTGREFYKIVLEDDVKQLYVTIFNTRDIAGLASGELVLIPVSKNKFGFTKSKDSKIKKLI